MRHVRGEENKVHLSVINNSDTIETEKIKKIIDTDYVLANFY